MERCKRFKFCFLFLMDVVFTKLVKSINEARIRVHLLTSREQIQSNMPSAHFLLLPPRCQHWKIRRDIPIIFPLIMPARKWGAQLSNVEQKKPQYQYELSMDRLMIAHINSFGSGEPLGVDFCCFESFHILREQFLFVGHYHPGGQWEYRARKRWSWKM